MKLSELQLADQVIEQGNHSLGILTVKNIVNGNVTFFRPFTHTADFSYTGGVICYVGIEEYTVTHDRSDYTLIERRTLK